MNTINQGFMKPDFTPLLLLLVLLVIILPGCTAHHAFGTNPDNARIYGDTDPIIKPVVGPDNVQPLFGADLDCSRANQYLSPVNYRVDMPLAVTAAEVPPLSSLDRVFSREISLSPGDLIEVVIEDGEGFGGRYELNANGFVKLPLIESIFAQGLTPTQLAEKIELALIKARYFRAESLSLSVQLLKLAEIEVTVSGAVFEPGRVLINEKIPAQLLREKTVAVGDYSPTRMLSEALRGASGVRPDAKLDQVRLVRQGWQVEVDMSGILSGQPVRDVALVAGDQVIVPTSGCFQPHLVRPSQITPKGFRVFMSNLIEPSYSNANAAVGSFSSSLPYGARLLQAVVSANCVGGKQWTNAARKVLLSSKNPLTGKVQVAERSIEQLMRNPELPTINPYLMPNDAIACYDSDASNLRDVARFFSDVLNPFTLKLE